MLLLSAAAVTATASKDDAGTRAYYTANALYNNALYELAADEYKAFLSKHSGHSQELNAKLGLALSLYQLERYADAEPIFAELAGNRDVPHREHVHNLLGQCLLVLGRPAEAEIAFRWSVTRGKERFFLEMPGITSTLHESPTVSVATVMDLEPLERSFIGLIEALRQQGKWGEVIAVSDDLAELVPDGRYAARGRFMGALARYELKQYGDAAAILEPLESKAADLTAHAVFLLAECKRELGELEEAASRHGIIVAERGAFAVDSLFRLGYIRFIQGRYDDAISTLKDLRAKHRDSEYFVEAGLFLGKSNLELERFTQAHEIFDELLQDKEFGVEATLWKGTAFIRQKKFDDALAVLKSGMEKFPDHRLLPDFLFEYAGALMGKEQFEEAAGTFARIFRDFSDSAFAPDSVRLEAFCLHRAGKYEASKNRCELFLLRYPEDPAAPDVLFLKAENLFFMERPDLAGEFYGKLIAAGGEYEDKARFRTGQAAFQRENWKAALERITPLLAREFDDPFFEQLYYLAGECFFGLKDWEPAVSYFRRFLSEHRDAPNADMALLKLALAYDHRKEGPEVISLLKEFLAEYPDSDYMPRVLAKLGESQYDQGQYEEAVHTLRRLKELDEPHEFLPQANYYLGWALAALKQTGEAIDHFAGVVRDFAGHILANDSLYQKALLLIEKENYAAAQANLENFLKSYPGDPKVEQASFYYGVTLSRSEQWERALVVLDEFVKKYPESPLLPYALYEGAWCSRELGLHTEAEKRYADIASSFPQYDLAEIVTLEWAEVGFDRKNYDEAMSLLNTLLETSENPSIRERAIYRMGWTLLGMEETAAAAEAFERMLKEYPDSDLAGVAAYQAGEARFMLKEFKKAVPLFARAAETAEDMEVKKQALVRVGESHTFTGDWGAANKAFTAFLKEYPESRFLRRAQLGLGWTLENQEAYAEAMDAYRLVLESGERDEIGARSQFQLGECLFATGEYDEAIKAFVMVDANYAFPVWSARALLQIGRALNRKGLTDEAKVRYRQVVERYPGTDEAVVARNLLE